MRPDSSHAESRSEFCNLQFEITAVRAIPITHAAGQAPMHIPESAHLWALFAAGHGLHVWKRASLSAASPLSGTKTRLEWLRVNALNLLIRFFVNAAAFSYWMAHPGVATHVVGSLGVPLNLTLEPGQATAALFGLSGNSLVDWAAAKVPFLQKEIPPISS